MMTTNPNNPFVLPVLSQTGEMASNPLFASLEMMRQTFSTLSGANGLMKGLSIQPTLDPAELEKKIGELKSVESWLKLNLSMLSSTIQGMEVQLATISTLQQFMAANTKSSPTASPTEIKTESKKTETPSKASETPATQPSADAAQAWWNMLTQQFGQIAEVTSASLKKEQATPSKPARTRTAVKKSAPRSTPKK